MAVDPPILLVGSNGEPFGRLRQGVLALVSRAEAQAVRENLAKSSTITATLKEQIEGAGYHVTAEALEVALRLIQQVRRGDFLPHISVTVQRVTAPTGRGDRTPLQV